MTPLVIRPYRADDAAATLRLFERAIGETALSQYTADQVRAWLGDLPEPQQWNDARLRVTTIVAEVDGQIAGFADISDDGYVDRLFVSPDFGRRGVGRALVEHLLTIADRRSIRTLSTHASLVARPVFESAGFRVEQRETVWRGDVALDRFLMTLDRQDGTDQLA